MIELTTLGITSLHNEDGKELRSVLSQPKRLSLLVYLAVAAPTGYVRRDTILGVFWPDAEMDRGRSALRQATRYLRRALGSGVIESRAAGELGVADDRIRCDAVEFAGFLDAGDLEGALDLYKGEFLAGMHISGAPEFESWLERVRTELRHAAVDAAWSLAERAEHNDRHMDAKSWAEWATSRSPEDELGIRRRMAMLDRLGDRATAVSVFERFAEHIRTEYGLQPAPETVELIGRIRRRESLGNVDPQRAQRPVSANAESSFAKQAAAMEPTLDPKRILVAILENRTMDSQHDAVGSMAADWIAQGLMGTGVFEVVPLTGVIASARHVHERAGERGTEETAIAMARETGAGTVVTGSYYRHGDNLQFHVQIVDARNETILHAPDPVEVAVPRLLTAIEELRERVVTVLAPLHQPHAKHVRAAQRPPSYAAFQEYVTGLEHFIRGEWAVALEHFHTCEQIEPSYWLPRIVAAIAQWNLGHLKEASATAQRIEQAGPTLGPFEREVLGMVRAWLRGDWSAAHAAAKRQADLTTGSIPHFQVAEEARRLNRLHEARTLLAAIDPNRGEMRGFLFYWIEATTVHHMLGLHRQELELARRARELHPDAPAVIGLELRALSALGRIDDVQSLLDENLATPWPDDVIWGRLAREAGQELRAHGHPDEAQDALERGLRWLLSQRKTGAPESLMQRELALAHYHCGNLDQAHDSFTSLAASDREFGAHHGHLHPHLDIGYVGVIAIRRDDAVTAEAVANELERMDGPFLFGRNTFWLAALAAVQGEHARTVDLLRSAFSQGLPHQPFLHLDPHIGRLKGFAPFEELMRPKG